MTIDQRLPSGYSSRVQLKSIPMFGTNRKRITEEACLVSGLAEFFERLQTFSLYKFRIPLSQVKSTKSFCYSPNERLMDISAYEIGIQESLEKHISCYQI